MPVDVPEVKNPTPGMCHAEVAARWTSWPMYSQCARKAVVDGKWCRQHDPREVERRRTEARERDNKKWAEELKQISGRRFYDVLQQIASGHNDPRGLAQETLDEFHERAKPTDE